MKIDVKSEHKLYIMLDIIGTDPFSLGDLGVVNLEKLKK